MSTRPFAVLMTRRIWTRIIPLTLAATTAFGQSGVPEVDSAQVARRAWRRAATLQSAGDFPGALSEVSRAAHAWPSQSAYWVGLARIAARSGNREGFDEALRTLTVMRLGGALAKDTLVQRCASPSALQQLTAAGTQASRARVVASLADTTVFAEGVDADPVTGALLVASIRHRTAYEVSRDGTWRDIGLGRQPGIGAVFGVRVAKDRTTLWVTTTGVPQMAGYVAADSAIAALLLVRRRDGHVLRRWGAPVDARGHVLGDLAVGPSGDVFVTDSRAPLIYRLRPSRDTLETLTSPLFRSLQGVAPAPDGSALFVSDYSHGLLRVDLASGAVTRLPDAPGSTALGVDAIVFDHNAIIGMQNGVSPTRLARFALDATMQRIVSATVLEQESALADEPVGVTIARGRLIFIGAGQWNKYDDDGRRLPGTHLGPTRLLALPLATGSAPPGH